MIEILVIIWVVKQFKELAEEKGLNRITWGIIGALSYYLPIILMGFVILPILAENGIFYFDDEFTFKAVALLINLATGILCCVIAFQILRRMNDGKNESTILDN